MSKDELVIDNLSRWEKEARECYFTVKTPSKRERLYTLSGKFSAVASLAIDGVLGNTTEGWGRRILDRAMASRDTSRKWANEYWD